MIVKAGLLIDLGNSETRVVVISGKNAYRFNMSNNFAELPGGYRIPRSYNNDKSTIFEINGTYFANGLIVEREFVGKSMRPSALQYKADQLVTDLTLNLAIIKAMGILGKAYNVLPTNLDVTFNVSVLLPPLDHEVNEERMADKIRSLSTVSTLIPSQATYNFKVSENVNVFSEAVAAFFGAYFKEDGLKELPESMVAPFLQEGVRVRDNGDHIQLVEVDENKKFATGYVLVLDIGAGTTDVALFKDMELVEMSKETFKRGGNTVASIVLNEIKKKYGFTPTDMQRVISTGILDEGEYKHDVSDIVTMAKEIYSKQTRSDLVPYLERMSLDMPVVKGLLVAGGGSLASTRKVATVEHTEEGIKYGPEVTEAQVANGAEYQEVTVSPAMSDILVGFLKELAPRIEVMNTEGKDLRELNIEGLILLHKYMG